MKQPYNSKFYYGKNSKMNAKEQSEFKLAKCESIKREIIKF